MTQNIDWLAALLALTDGKENIQARRKIAQGLRTIANALDTVSDREPRQYTIPCPKCGGQMELLMIQNQVRGTCPHCDYHVKAS